jgi:hypothetical protein
MRYFALVLLVLGLNAGAQNTFYDFLDSIQPTTLEQAVRGYLKPPYQDALKKDLSQVEDFVEHMKEVFQEPDAKDIEAWKDFVQFVTSAGYPMNDYKKLTPLFQLTFDLVYADNASRGYLYHTTLLELGGKSEIVYDNLPFFGLVLQMENENIRDAYIADFKKWDKDRKDKFLVSITEPSNYYEYTEMVNQIVSSKLIDPNYLFKGEKKSFFDRVVMCGNLDAAGMLIAQGYLLNRRCLACSGETSLHRACGPWSDDLREDESLYQLIINMMNEGADPNLKDLKGLTPLHYAIKANNESAFRALISEGSTVDFNMRLIKGSKFTDYLAFYDSNWKKGDRDLREILATRVNRPVLKKDLPKEEKKGKKEKK